MAASATVLWKAARKKGDGSLYLSPNLTATSILFLTASFLAYMCADACVDSEHTVSHVEQVPHACKCNGVDGILLGIVRIGDSWR